MAICVFFIPILVFLSTIGNAQAQAKKSHSYYISLSGNDKNNGTISSPWQTIEKINSTQLNAGDKVFFKGGDIFKGALHPSIDSLFEKTQRVLIGSYGRGSATINAGNVSAIIIESAQFVTVQDLILKGAGRKEGNTGDGVALTNCTKTEINNVDVSGFRNAGINVSASTGIRVTNVYAHDNGFAGISVIGRYQEKNSCKDIYIGHCRADNNPGSPVILDNHSGNGIVAGSCSKLMIEYCTATNNGWDMPRQGNGPVGIWCYEADSVIIQYCVSYRNKTSVGGDDGGGFDLDGGVTNSIIQYCISYENQGSGYGIFQYAGASPWYSNTIRFNVSENDGLVSAAHAGFFIWNSSEDSTQFYDCVFYNNTIYNSKGSAINFARQSDRKNFSFYNNIFVAGDSLLKGKRTGDKFLANNWWNLENGFNIEGSNSLADWAMSSGQEMMAGKLAGSNTDPGLRINGSIADSSPSVSKLSGRYAIPKASILYKNGIDLQSAYQIHTGNIDLSSQAAPVKGIGASFIRIK